MANFTDKISDFKERIKRASVWLDLSEKEKKIFELENLVSRPDFWGIPEEASRISRELAELKEESKLWKNLNGEISDFEELVELSVSDPEIEKELESRFEILEKNLKKEELKFFLSGKYDRSRAVFLISAGQGGREAEDFVRILFRMYSAYFERKRWSFTVLHEHFSDDGSSGSAEAGGEPGLKNISFEVDAPFAYGYLKNESGVHRLVRVSPFDAKKLRHTSFALVEVMPEVENVDLDSIELDEKDLKVEFFRSSGPGGQNVNKRETAVRIVHLPTGVAVNCQSERSQAQNREKALYLLKIKLFDYLKKQKSEEKEFLKKRVEPSWGNQIRNYVLHPYKLIKDLRTEIEKTDIESILEGDIEDFIEAELVLNKNQDLSGQ